MTATATATWSNLSNDGHVAVAVAVKVNVHVKVNVNVNVPSRRSWITPWAIRDHDDRDADAAAIRFSCLDTAQRLWHRRSVPRSPSKPPSKPPAAAPSSPSSSEPHEAPVHGAPPGVDVEEEGDTVPNVGATVLVSQRAPARTRRHPWRTLAIILCGAFVVAAAVGVLLRRLDAPTGPPLLLGLAPRFTHEQVAELRPFLDHIGRRIGRRIEARPMRDYESLRTGLLLGQHQLASLPHLQLLLTRREGRQLSCLATETFEGSPTYTSIFVARDNSGIAAVADLRGKRFCYIDAGSASGFLVPRLFLRERGLDPDRLFSAVRYSNGAFAALRDVVEGRCDAAAIGASNLFLAAQHGVPTSRLRTILTAGQIPLDTICASPSLPPALFGDLRRALLAFQAQRDIDRTVLGPSFIVDGFTDPRWADFDLVERAARTEKIIP